MAYLLHQYSSLARSKSDSMQAKLIKPFFPNVAEKVMNAHRADVFFSDMSDFQGMVHELAHCIDFFQRGKRERLKRNNFGFRPNYGSWTIPNIELEVDVVAIQYAIEKQLDKTLLEGIDGWSIMDRAVTVFERHYTSAWEPGLARAVEEQIKEKALKLEPRVKEMAYLTDQYLAINCLPFMTVGNPL